MLSIIAHWLKHKKNTNLINKIGKKLINIETPINAVSWATFDIRPDNKLLVRKFAENSYQIVHNITQLAREYEMEQYGPKIK